MKKKAYLLSEEERNSLLVLARNINNLSFYEFLENMKIVEIPQEM